MAMLPDPAPISGIDELLDPFRSVIGRDFDGYRNHVQRMAHACIALGVSDPQEREKIIVAACFHDIGLWTASTFDYVGPSIAAARTHLVNAGREGWCPDVEVMIEEHHKLRPFRESRLVELFRRADLVDFSLGLVRFGIPRSYLRMLRARYPNAGFHRGLVRRALAWFVRHPSRPIPMVRW